MDKQPPAMFATAGNFLGNVDRWQLINWTAPTHVVIDAGVLMQALAQKTEIATRVSRSTQTTP